MNFSLRASVALVAAWSLLTSPCPAAEFTGFKGPQMLFIASCKESFVSGGKRIQVDVYDPVFHEGHPRVPTILVLHGAGGMVFDGPEMKRVAKRLAEAGNRVYLVHYFNRTGTLFSRDAVLRKLFLPEWLPTVRDAVDWAYARQEGPRRPIGIFGYSLGAFAAVRAASDNPKVGAIAEQSGGIWDNKAERIGRMPSVLMIHGRKDQRVPFVQYAQRLEAVLRKRAASLETRFYDDESHVFKAPAAARAREQEARFFAAKFGQRKP